MARAEISRKYAKALLEAALENQQLDSLLDEVAELEKSLKESQASSFLTSLIVSDSEKSELLYKIAEKASKLLGNFLKTIADNRRYAILLESLISFKSLANKALGRDEVEVVTSVTLSEKQREKMTEFVKTKFELKNVTLVNRVDDRILGGFIIHNDAKILDASIKLQLAKIAAEL